MGKLKIVVEKAPEKVSRESKNVELYQEIATAFEGLAIGECFVINDEDIAVSSLTANIKSYINFKEGENLRLSRLTKEENGSDKIYAVRLTKIASKPAPATTSGTAQGEAKDFN